MNAAEDGSGVHEVSSKAVYENKFDGITRCLRKFFWRHPPRWSGKLTRLENMQPFVELPEDWIIVSATEKPVTCLGCLGADPWL